MKEDLSFIAEAQKILNAGQENVDNLHVLCGNCYAVDSFYNAENKRIVCVRCGKKVKDLY